MNTLPGDPDFQFCDNYAQRVCRLTDDQVKEIYHRALKQPPTTDADEAGRLPWFKSFAGSVLLAQGEDFHWLRPSAVLIIAQYKLL